MELYLGKLEQPLANARRIAADETHSRQAYYIDKVKFLESVKSLLAGEQATFEPMFEPFFWGEFKRVTEIFAHGPKDAGKGWKRAAVEINRKFVAEYNKLRALRDGYVTKIVGVREHEVICAFAGTIMYLERAIAKSPENLKFLQELLARYQILYQRSGLLNRTLKWAPRIGTARFGWRNYDTVLYIKLQQKPKVKNYTPSTSNDRAPSESPVPALS